MGFSVVSGQINNIKHIDRNWLGQAKSLCTPEDSADFGLDNIEAEINLLEHELQYEYKQQEIGFCHNDLQYGNIMIDEDTNSITIIVSFSLPLQNIIITHELTLVFYNRTTSMLVITQLHTT